MSRMVYFSGYVVVGEDNEDSPQYIVNMLLEHGPDFVEASDWDIEVDNEKYVIDYDDEGEE